MKRFTYTHGPTIPKEPPERRSDWKRPDGWIPTEWARVPQNVRDAIYEEWKEKEPEAVQKALETAKAYDAAVKANREAMAKAEEEKKAKKAEKKAAKEAAKQGGAPSGSATSDFERRIVHFCADEHSFLHDLMGSQCDVRVVNEISST